MQGTQALLPSMAAIVPLSSFSTQDKVGAVLVRFLHDCFVPAAATEHLYFLLVVHVGICRPHGFSQGCLSGFKGLVASEGNRELFSAVFPPLFQSLSGRVVNNLIYFLFLV